MMPEGIGECPTCGVPIAAYGGGICDDCAFYTSLRSPRVARWLDTHGRHSLASLVWHWVAGQIAVWRERKAVTP